MGEPAKDSELIRVLKEGYWERSAVVRTPDGELRVRKESRAPAGDAHPWARRSLLREISYMQNLPPAVADLFPPLLASWGADGDGPVGYEMPYFKGWSDLGSLVCSGGLAPDRARELGTQVAGAIIDLLQREQAPPEALSAHVEEVMDVAVGRLEEEGSFGEIINASEIEIDGEQFRGLRHSLERIRERSLYEKLDAPPQVRLHGDLILENILIPNEAAGADRPFVFIDPVSVAGIDAGHPAFDLVKYESYASGQLFAIRTGALVGGASEKHRGVYTLRCDARQAGENHFAAAGLDKIMRQRYRQRYGEPDSDLLRLLDGYFSLAMAINTTGAQPLTRALMAAKALHAATRQ